MAAGVCDVVDGPYLTGWQGRTPGRPARARRLVPAPAAAGMDEEMSTISDAAVDDLTFDPDVDASGITVQDGDGDVVLTGSVPSYPHYVEAAAVAGRVPVSRACTTAWRSRCRQAISATTRH